jgi:hypothetical protein
VKQSFTTFKKFETASKKDINSACIYLNIASKTIIDAFTFVSGQVSIIHSSLDGSDYYIIVELNVLSKETNEETTLLLEYSDIGEVNLVFGQ